MNTTIAVVGSINMDLVVRTPHIPQPGETILGSDFQVIPGGKGANQAVAAARLGAQVRMVGRVGQDEFAGTLLETLQAAGIDHHFVGQDPEAATGVALIEVDDGGENSIVVAPGANSSLTPAHIEAAAAAIAAATVLLLQLETPLPAVRRAAELAHEHGVTVILNPAPAPAEPLPAALLAAIDILTPNEGETERLTGLPVHTPDEIEAAAAKLRQQGVDTIILTLGNRGAWLAEAAGSSHIPPFEITPVDTTAAGDAFMGGLAVALAEGRPLSEAVRWGNAAGALAATKIGAQPSVPSRTELEAFLTERA